MFAAIRFRISAMPVVTMGIVENSIRSVSFLLLLCALNSAPRAAAQKSCMVTFTCPSAGGGCASAMGGQVTTRGPFNFASTPDCNTQVRSANSSTIMSGVGINCSCTGGSAPALAPAAAAPATLNPALSNAAQSIGNSIGTALGQRLGKMLFGDPAAKAAADAADQQNALAAQQSALAAQQLNDSGLYLMRQRNFAGAINEFQQALAIAPNDANILHNLEMAKQKLKGAAIAGQTSGALGQLLGTAPTNTGIFGFAQLTDSTGTNPNASALSLVNLDSDAKVVDLRGTTNTFVDPETLKGQLDAALSNNTPDSTRPGSPVVLPQDKDMELLSTLSQSGTSQSQVVLPQDKDMELLGFPPTSGGSNLNNGKAIVPATASNNSGSNFMPASTPSQTTPASNPLLKDAVGDRTGQTSAGVTTNAFGNEDLKDSVRDTTSPAPSNGTNQTQPQTQRGAFGSTVASPTDLVQQTTSNSQQINSIANGNKSPSAQLNSGAALSTGSGDVSPLYNGGAPNAAAITVPRNDQQRPTVSPSLDKIQKLLNASPAYQQALADQQKAQADLDAAKQRLQNTPAQDTSAIQTAKNQLAAAESAHDSAQVKTNAVQNKIIYNTHVIVVPPPPPADQSSSSSSQTNSSSTGTTRQNQNSTPSSTNTAPQN